MAGLSVLFKEFVRSEKAGGFVLIICTILSLVLANLPGGSSWAHFFHQHVDLSVGPLALDFSIEHWVNDGLMTIFFLLVGLEIERELYIGELSSFKNALLPILAAGGGMLVPALIHFLFNAGTDTAAGFGIPMATDIAFALGVLSFAGNRIPVSLKIFLTALAIIDDLGAITVIALFYTNQFNAGFFFAAIGIFVVLYVAGRLGFRWLWVYLVAGVIMWYCMLQSGVHASIAGVLLAFAVPFDRRAEGGMSYRLQHALHYPVAFFILPVFALVNTAIVFPASIAESFTNRNGLGILLGLLIGKLAGIFLVSFAAVKLRIAALAPGITWGLLAGLALLGGIGFTMSIFITNLAFGDEAVIAASKMSILLASVLAALLGLLVLRAVTTKKAAQ